MTDRLDHDGTEIGDYWVCSHCDGEWASEEEARESGECPARLRDALAPWQRRASAARQRAEEAGRERDALAGQVAAWAAAWRATGLDAFVASEGGASENWDAIRAVLADTTDAAEEHDRRVRREALREAATLARGCHDYNGGHTAEPEHGIYHHGIDTVVNVLDRAVEGEDDYQMRAVRREGERARAEEVDRG